MNPKENKKRTSRRILADKLVRKLTLAHVNQRLQRRSLRLQLLSLQSLMKSTVVMRDERGPSISVEPDIVLLLFIKRDMCIHPRLKIVPNKLTFSFFPPF